MIDFLRQDLALKPSRIYKEKARKEYLNVAQSKKKSVKIIRKAIQKQLNYIEKNLYYIHQYLDQYSSIPFRRTNYKDFIVIQTLYEHQRTMFVNRVQA